MLTAAAQFGALVRAARKASGLKAWQVADKADIDAKHLGRIERGEKQPSFELIIALAMALNVSPSRFPSTDTTEPSASKGKGVTLIRIFP